MTMLSFRVTQTEADQVQHWAQALGVKRSELLRDALHRHLVSLCGEQDSLLWEQTPQTEDETSVASIADWGPAEDWADWDDA